MQTFTSYRKKITMSSVDNKRYNFITPVSKPFSTPFRINKISKSFAYILNKKGDQHLPGLTPITGKT